MVKRIAFSLLVILCLAVNAASTAEIWYVQTQNGKPLNVRSQASKSSGIIATLNNGSAVEVLQLLQDGEWAQISLGNRTGYCMTSYLAQGDGELGYMLTYDKNLFTFEQSDGIDTYWWNGQTEGLPDGYLSVSRLTGYTLEEAMDGLVLQSGVEGERSTLTLDGQDALSYSFSEDTQEAERVVQYVCVEKSDGSILLIELSCNAGVRETVEPYLQEMLSSITLSGQSGSPASGSAAPGPEYVQCEICGEWFKAGNEFRNHQCVTYPGEDYAASGNAPEMVQCEVCGEWFEAGNEFRNHQCVTYPGEDYAK